MEGEILKTLDEAGDLHITDIADRIDSTLVDVDRRCFRLHQEGYIRIIDTGVYRLTDTGEHRLADVTDRVMRGRSRE